MKSKYQHLIERNWKHGFSQRGKVLPEYDIWVSMLSRCRNKKNKQYKDYGGRGIKVCRRWHKFINFYKDMGPRPSIKYSLDRINNNKGYIKSNCKWSTKIEQNRNSRHCHLINYKGQKLPVSEVAQLLHIPYFKFYDACRNNDWNVQTAILRCRE